MSERTMLGIKKSELGQARQTIRENASADVLFYVMNALATTIASYGLLADNATSVIGAMIVATMVWKVNGVGLALVEGDGALLRKSLAGFLSGTVMIVAIAMLIGLVHRQVPLRGEVLARTHPTLLDLAVAFFSGMAGTIAIISPRLSAALVGIAISTAIVPPMAAAGLLAARGNWPLAAQAGLLVLINIVAIQLATSIVLWACGVAQLRRVDQTHRQVLVRNVVSLSIVALLAGVLLSQLHAMVREAGFQAECTDRLTTSLQSHADAHVVEVRFERVDGNVIIRAVVRAANLLTAADVALMQSKLPAPYSDEKVELRIRQVRVEVMTADGPLYNDSFNWTSADAGANVDQP